MNHTAATDRSTLLIVDDSTEILDALKAILAPEYTVKAAVDGPLALKIAWQAPPDLILLDVMMPGMDGYTVCRHLKQDLRTRDVPVIFLTALSESGEEAYGLQMGAVDYIPKPVNVAILRARIRTHLNLYAARRRLEAQNITLKKAAAMREEVEHLMRHDLKAPINALVGIPQVLLMDDNLTPQQRHLIQTMEDTGWRMLRMMDLSLILWKMEAGRYAPEPGPVDLMAITRSALLEMQAMTQKKKLTLSTALQEEAPERREIRNPRPLREGDRLMVMAEELLCHCMLANLLKNAIEASEKEDALRLVFFPDPQQPGLSIENSGEVPEDIRDRFFEKYVTSGKKSGTGLGTYSARLIARTLRGDLFLDTSKPGYTRIHLHLPAAASASGRP